MHLNRATPPELCARPVKRADMPPPLCARPVKRVDVPPPLCVRVPSNGKCPPATHASSTIPFLLPVCPL
eukprot:4748407-Prymnesium_polylepis.1